MNESSTDPSPARTRREIMTAGMLAAGGLGAGRALGAPQAKDDPAKYAKLQERTNVNGGAIAVGHPVGASGARITMALTYELMRRGGGKGVAAICGGLSQGEALIVSV